MIRFVRMRFSVGEEPRWRPPSSFIVGEKLMFVCAGRSFNFNARGVLVGFCGFSWNQGLPYLLFSSCQAHLVCFHTSCCSCSSLGCSTSSPSKAGGVSSSGFSLSWSVSNPWVRLSRIFFRSCSRILPRRFLPGRTLELFFTSWDQRVTPPAHFRSFVHSTSLFPSVATSFLLYSGSWNFLCTRAAISVCSSSSVQFKFLILFARALQRLGRCSRRISFATSASPDFTAIRCV